MGRRETNQDLADYKFTLSVAMCTYNGEPYLQEQLISIARQTRLPDELVVCDDGSTDATLQILKKFQETAPFPVKIYCNETNLDLTKNFEKAITLCSGNIIVLSDQDDVWMPQKLERLKRALEDHPDAGYVFSDALIVDEQLHSLCYTMWERISFTACQRGRFKQGRQLEVLLKHNVITGATMAFRAELQDWVLPIPEQWIHDAWIALLSSAAGTRGVFIKEPLVKYRQHHNQVIGGRKIGFHEQFRRAISTKGETYNYEQVKFSQALDRLISTGRDNRKTKELINAKIQHLKARETLYNEYSLLKRVGVLLQELLAGRYPKFSNGLESIVKDLFIAIGSRCPRG
jgi:glycosyltransferase involved in cell wall biosynthesis